LVYDLKDYLGAELYCNSKSSSITEKSISKGTLKSSNLSSPVPLSFTLLKLYVTSKDREKRSPEVLRLLETYSHELDLVEVFISWVKIDQIYLLFFFFQK